MTNEQLVIRIKTGIDVAENMLQLWQQNQGFISKQAWKYRGYEDLDDLKQEGYFGLCHAVDGFNPDEGIPFINYAAFWIRQSMQRYIENSGSVVRIPVHARSRVGKYKKFLTEFEKYYGRKPADWETCRFLGLSEEMLKSIQETANIAQIGSLDSPLRNSDDQELTVGDSVADPKSLEDSVLDEIQRQQLKETIWSAVDALPGQQSQVIQMRYQERLTLKETGERIGISMEAVRQHQNKALRALRSSRKLRPFWYDKIYSKGIRGGGVGRFNQTWTSSTEYAALWLLDETNLWFVD